MNNKCDMDQYEKELVAELEERIGEKFKVEKIMKNNGVYQNAIMPADRVEMVYPLIYTEEAYASGYTAADYANCYMEHLNSDYTQSLSDFGRMVQDFEYAKDRIIVTLINAEKNMELLKDTPYLNLLDLAVVFRIMLGQDHSATILVNNSLTDKWGTDVNELYWIAKRNTKRLLQSPIAPFDGPPIMWFAAHKDYSYGAAAILYKEELAAFAHKVDDDFYIIPSSVHELIYVPKKLAPEKDSLCETIRQINDNRSLIKEKEVLSYNLYCYDRETNTVSIV